jgi:hypothetical protein
MEQIFTPEECAQIMAVKRKVEAHTLQMPRAIYRRRHVVAGGCFASYFHNEEPNDIDVFILASTASTAVTLLPSTNFANFVYSDPQYLNNDNIISVVKDPNTNIQYIFSKHITRRALLKEFDFLHCAVSYYDKEMYISRSMFDAIMNKKLVILNKDHNKRNIEYRERKFLDRGWTK